MIALILASALNTYVHLPLPSKPAELRQLLDAQSTIMIYNSDLESYNNYGHVGLNHKRIACDLELDAENYGSFLQNSLRDNAIVLEDGSVQKFNIYDIDEYARHLIQSVSDYWIGISHMWRTECGA